MPRPAKRTSRPFREGADGAESSQSAPRSMDCPSPHTGRTNWRQALTWSLECQVPQVPAKDLDVIRTPAASARALRNVQSKYLRSSRAANSVERLRHALKDGRESRESRNISDHWLCKDIYVEGVVRPWCSTWTFRRHTCACRCVH